MTFFLFFYLVLILFVVFLSIKVADTVDLLDKKTHMSGAFIGGVILAATTSLPEFFTSISSVTVVDNSDLVMGNIFGSNIFNLTVLGLIILIFINKFSINNLSKNHTFSTMVLILITGILFVFPNIEIKFFYFMDLNIKSILIIILYFLVIKFLSSEESDSSLETDPRPDLTKIQVISRFILLSVLIVVSSIILTYVSDKIASQINLNSTVAGAVLLGIATSLPEVVSSIALARIGNFNAVIGNIIGSNIFNLTILSFVDLLSTKNLYTSNNSSNVLVIVNLISMSILYIMLYIRNKTEEKFIKKNTLNKKYYVILSLLMVSMYFVFMFKGQ